MFGVAFDNILKLLRACSSLEELVLHDVQAIDMAALLAFPNIKRLAILAFRSETVSTVNMTVNAVMLRPDLDHLRTYVFDFSRAEHKLKLPSHGTLSTAHLSRLISPCNSVKELSVSSLLDDGTASLMVDRLGGSLRALTLCVQDFAPLEILLQRYGRTLRSLALDNDYEFLCTFALIGATCPQLISLSVRICNHSDEEGFSALFSACTELKELTLALVSCLSFNGRDALRAIVDNRLRLRVLTLKEAFDKSDAVWFRQLARDQQLLPVPQIVLVGFEDEDSDDDDEDSTN